MEPWKPTTFGELEALITDQLQSCSPDLQTLFERYKTPLTKAPLWRFNTLESVFIVAQKGQEVMYYEDVEEGFNFSPLSPEGVILHRGCNQDDLSIALLRWA